MLAELHVSRRALGQALVGLGVLCGNITLLRADLTAPTLRAGFESHTSGKSHREPSQEGSVG